MGVHSAVLLAMPVRSCSQINFVQAAEAAGPHRPAQPTAPFVPVAVTAETMKYFY